HSAGQQNRRDYDQRQAMPMGRMMRGLFAVLALLTTAVSIAEAGERYLPVKCLTPNGVEESCAAWQHLPPNKQNALPRTARPSVLPPPECDKPFTGIIWVERAITQTEVHQACKNKEP